MVSWSATIAGTTVQDVFNVEYATGQTGKLGSAIIECANTSTNRSFGSGDKVSITKNGEKVFSGFLTGKPTKAGTNSATLEIECKDTRLELKYEQVNRVFYDMDTGQAIRDALNYTVEPKDRKYIYVGNTTTGWTTDAPVFELGDIDSQSLQQAGHDFLFVGWHKGASGLYEVTYSGVPSAAIPGDGQIDRLETRLLVNNRGQQFDMEVNLRDNAGNNYNWPLKTRGNDFTVHELNAEEANTQASIGSALTTDGTLQYRFKITGELPESRAVALDFARSYPFTLTSRPTTLTDSGVDSTDHSISRRVDRSIFEMIQDYATEDDFISFATVNDVLHYEASGQTTAPDIDYSNTPVVSAEFKRDYENIVNKVTVQGAGDIRVTLQNNQSIKFYGVSPREKPLVDTQIQSKDSAIKRGRGYLKKNAWADTAFRFEIADTSYKNVNVGEDIYVNWPPENIQGTYAVSEVEAVRAGVVSLGVTATSAI